MLQSKDMLICISSTPKSEIRNFAQVLYLTCIKKSRGTIYATVNIADHFSTHILLSNDAN